MSNAVTNRCRDAVLPPPAKAVLMCLADRADDLGVCWPAQSYISRWTCYGRTAVISAVRFLEEKGLITVSRQNGRGNRTTINLAAVDAYILQQSTTSMSQQPVVPADAEQFAGRTAHISEAHRASPPGAHKTSGSSYIKKDRRPLPAEWSPTTELLAWARGSRPDLAIELVVEVFRNHYLAAGDAKADWEACFRAWILRERIQATRPAPQPTTVPVATARDPALVNTVPVATARDPALVKIDTDSRLAVPPPPLHRERLAQLRMLIAGTSSGSRT